VNKVTLEMGVCKVMYQFNKMLKYSVTLIIYFCECLKANRKPECFILFKECL
jgi:hypothetical protein